MITNPGKTKFNCANTENLYNLYTKNAIKCKTCALITLSNVGVYRKIFKSNLAQKYIVFDEGFLSIKNLCKEYDVDFVEINTENIIEKITGKNMKFDLIIGNPPYTKGGKATQPLYAEIACKIFENTNNMIWICPTSWTHKIEYDVSKEKYRKELENYFVSCDLVEPELLGISITDKLGIYLFDKNNTKLAPFEEWKFYNCSNPSLTKSILEKVKNKTNDTLQNHYHKKEGKYIVQAAACRGHVNSWDWTTMFDKTNRNLVLTNFNDISKDRFNWWTFENKSACEHFKKYTETNTFMFIMKCYKTGLIQPLNKLPWFDFNNVIDDLFLATEFEFTNEEIKYIDIEMLKFGWKAKSNKKGK